MMFVGEAVPQTTPLQCFSSWGCDGVVAGAVLITAVWAVLIAGALIMPRWRDMFLVAAVTIAAALLGEWTILLLLYGEGPYLGIEFATWFLAVYGLFLAAAFAVHGLKRAVLWLVGYSVASPT